MGMFFFFAYVNIIWLAIYGYYIPANVRVGLSVPQVEEIRLEDSFIVLKTKETGQIFAEYGALFAVSTQPPKENAPNKAGFA